jgi:hypothetical protein
MSSQTGGTAMKAKADAQRGTPTIPVPAVSKLTSASVSVATNNDAITDAQLQELAYKLCEERGRVDGNDLQDWFEAESILRERGKLAA